MKRYRVPLLLAVLLGGLTCWLLVKRTFNLNPLPASVRGDEVSHEGDSADMKPAPSVFAAIADLSGLHHREPIPAQLDKRLTHYTNGTVDYNPAVEQSRQFYQSSDPREDLQHLEDVINHYRSIYKENPVGSENQEITEQLLGFNEKKVVFLDPVVLSLSSHNELLDRWGSPFIFHPLSSSEMEFRSLGPDRKLWTDDDLILDFGRTEQLD